MKISEALRRHLFADAAVKALAFDRIYPGFSPGTNIAPAEIPLVSFRIQRTFGHTLTETAIKAASAEIRSWSDDYDEAHDLSEAIVSCLDNFRGVMGGAGGVTIQHWLVETEEDGEEAVTPDLILLPVITRFDVMFVES